VARKTRVLAVSSGGGHWVQLLRLRPALEADRVVFVCVRREYQADVPDARLYVINDATRWDKAGLVRMALRLLVIMLRERPTVVVTTGAAPGYFALRLGRLLRARTIWIDSIANVERLSLSGERAGRHADLWLTQWPHLERDGGPRYEGAVL